MISLYRPHIQQGYDLMNDIFRRHSEDLAHLALNWKEYKLKDQDGSVVAVQLLPWVKADFKGAVA